MKEQNHGREEGSRMIAGDRRLHGNLKPAEPIDEDAIKQALEYPATSYFITTNLYWDCECDTDYHRPRNMDLCEYCGTCREDAPDSRINELEMHGIRLDFADGETLATLDQHSAGSRRREKASGS